MKDVWILHLEEKKKRGGGDGGRERFSSTGEWEITSRFALVGYGGNCKAVSCEQMEAKDLSFHREQVKDPVPAMVG